MRPSRLVTAAVPIVAITATLAACSADANDFSDNAEQLIDDDKDGDLANALGVDFDGAECTEPADTDTGTPFECTATGDDGNTWIFTATITGDRDYEIVDAQIVGEPAATTTEPAAVTNPATTAVSTAAPATTTA